MLLAIFLYIFKVYVKISHLNKLYITYILSSIITALGIRKHATKEVSIISKLVIFFIISCLPLGLANYLPNFTIGYLAAHIVAEITTYFHVYHYIDLRLF